MMRWMGVVALCVLAAACARRPDDIAAADIPASAYSHMACPQLASERRTEEARLAGLAAAQNSAATHDAVGVLLIGVPTGSLTGGNKETDVAVSKGKIAALDSAQRAKRCVMM